MAASTGILLTMGAIGAGNEWLHGNADAAVKISVATLGSAVIFAGIEQLPGGRPFAVGVAAIALVGVLVGAVTPGVPSPAQQILDFINGAGGATATRRGGGGNF
jgi:hypothetical protein